MIHVDKYLKKTKFKFQLSKCTACACLHVVGLTFDSIKLVGERWDNHIKTLSCKILNNKSLFLFQKVTECDRFTNLMCHVHLQSLVFHIHCKKIFFKEKITTDSSFCYFFLFYL